MIYSPSFTKLWDRCQVQAYLEKKQQWVPRNAGPGLIGRIGGTSFHAAAALLHKRPDVNANDCTQFGIESWLRMTECYRSAGGYIPQDKHDEALATLKRAIPKYHKECPFRAPLWSNIQAEVTLKDYGPCRLDVTGVHHTSGASIVDLKYKRYMSNDYVDWTVSDYAKDWQFFHYKWAWCKQYQVPTVAMWVCLVIAEPRWQIRLVELPLSEGFYNRYQISAEAKWGRMETAMNTHQVLEFSTEHKDRWGNCPMMDACFKYNLDQDRMKEGYIKVEWPYEGDDE